MATTNGSTAIRDKILASLARYRALRIGKFPCAFWRLSSRPGLTAVVVDPVSRVEGHGKVTLLLDENNKVQQARLHIVEFRGFEKFIQGRPYWELPVLVQRLCGMSSFSSG